MNILLTERLKSDLARCSVELNEACNEAQKAYELLPAALMSEHKDH